MFIPSKKSAFSLIEIVLALGVISFALVGIMGLFPVALRSAQESQRETRAALIAQQIFSDLRAGTGTKRFVTYGSSPTIFPVTISNHGSNAFLVYNPSGFGITNISESEFFGPYDSTNAAFLAQISINTNTGIPNLSQVQTTVETPAIAPTANRSKYTFVTLMNY